jgi:TetR/AcrR family transcriptional repressor of bet genes
MPKIGMEPARRRALIAAAVGEIGAAGSLDVTVSQIARRAGMSPALAHHYFGSKDEIFLAAMRHILGQFGEDVRRRLRRAQTPLERAEAVIEASFAPSQFGEGVAAAWLVFYVRALHVPEAARLLAVYAGRLRSNLVHALRGLVPPAEAGVIAASVGAMIDGAYLRTVLPVRRGAADPAAARAMVRNHLMAALGGRA